ncbi:hypothetical protein AT15_07145 [Kosmotoga arenicorallina S304]|uniref:Fibronectin type-III domain-containing protein n=1 Tax=Kosmotoga arenicorallina S304 TaxID=1453497 RepID=A0A182C7K3_9BACT|nr:hypothetical protein [Kosmotoga arenicorallina]OAA31264.1 hypothetical protein AT15_07145 [Kosmotoga arenicorallina S304]
MRISLFMLFLLMTISAFSVDYSAYSPFPESGTIITPFNDVIKLSWRVDNLYDKTLIYYLYLSDGEKETSYGPLQESNFSISVIPGKTYFWRVKTKVYDKEYWSDEWNFRIPKTHAVLFGDAGWDYPVDAKLFGNKLLVLSKKISMDGSLHCSTELIELSERYEVLSRSILGSFVPTSFFDNGILGYEESAQGVFPIIRYNDGSTDTVFPEALSSIQVLKSFEDIIICVGREKVKTVAWIKVEEKVSKIELSSLSINDAAVLGKGIVFVGATYKDNLSFPVVVLKDGKVLVWEHQGWLLKVIPGEEERLFYVLGIVPTPTGDNDVVLRKYTVDGVVLWSKTIDDFRDDIVGDLLLSDSRINILEAVYDDEGYNQRIFMYSLEGEPMGIIEYQSANSEKPQKLLKIASGFLSTGYSYKDNYRTQVIVRFFSEP